MSLSKDALAVLEVIPQPALLVDWKGRLGAVNRRAQVLLPSGSLGQSMGDLCAGGLEDMRRFLDRCRGSSGGLMGAIVLKDVEGAARKHRCRGARLSLQAGPGVLLTFEAADEERFVALSRKVGELQTEVRERRRAEAVLAESVRERDLLLRELQHRVKNNVHMLVGLLQGAERETPSLEARAVLRDISRRFGAVGAVQQLVYGTGGLEIIDGAELVGTVARSVAAMAQGDLHLTIETEPISLPIEAAVPVALILNELVTNAVKYGRPADGQQRVAVNLQRKADCILLEVQDNGPGFVTSEVSRRASGFGLVRGLLRQIGGSLSATTSGAGKPQGARCTVQFPDPAGRQTGGHSRYD